MYDELIANLRNCAEVNSLSRYKRDLMKQAADAIEGLEEKWQTYAETLYAYEHPWIPVTERLPEHEYGESKEVLTVDLYGLMRVAYFNGGNWCWPSGEAITTMRVAPITHWMPLPEPPKGERA